MSSTKAASYARKRAAAREKSAAESRAGRDIGHLPPVRDPERKAHGLSSLRFFAETYFPLVFHMKWSANQLKVLEKAQTVVETGGQFALAMERGGGKSTMFVTAAMYAVFGGWRSFPVVIGATGEDAKSRLASIRTHLSTNELLLADFPEICYPVWMLENQPRRCQGQTYQGRPTYIAWGGDEIVLPTIPGSRASGAILTVGGITGSVRGANVTTPDGRSVRPDLVLLDDPQTDESAKSPSQVESRLETINGSVLGLAGPGKKLACLAAVTVISADDVADQLLDRKKNPDWQGERMRMLVSPPKNTKLWDEYERIRAESLDTRGGISAATEFYRENRAAMDEGAEASWEERFNHDELSAVQHAMNLKIRNPHAFAAEYQNEPIRVRDREEPQITAEVVLNEARLSRLERRAVPTQATALVGGIDVQGSLLYYLVQAVSPDFTTWVVDYGSEPEQDEEVFTLRDAKRTFNTERAVYGATAGAEGMLYAAIRRLQSTLMKRTYATADGAKMVPDRILVDANYGPMSDVVYQACADSEWSGVFTPSHGKGIGASSAPMSQWADKPGMRRGLNWQYGPGAKRRDVRHVLYDTNFWKSFTAARVRAAVGDHGCLRLFGGSIHRHRMLADHLSSEYAVDTQGRARTVQEWWPRPGRDNHLFDCKVMADVAASIQGCALQARGDSSPAVVVRRRKTVAEWKAEAEKRRMGRM